MTDDLLSAFLGLSGTYVRAVMARAGGGDRVTFEVLTYGQLDAALQEMASKLLPMW